MAGRKKEFLFAVVLGFFVLGPLSVFGEVISVSLDGLSDHNRIQNAIDAAVDGDVVVVADGVYTGEGNRDIDFLGKAITVKSAGGAVKCTIDIAGSEKEPHRGFCFHSGEEPSSVLEGFTITGGYATAMDVKPCGLEESAMRPNEPFGGGIYCDNASPTIVNCIISGNKTSEPSAYLSPLYNRFGSKGSGGAGLYCKGERGPSISRCVISDNHAVNHYERLKYTGQVFDMAIDGAGYFELSNDGEMVYTRIGSFAIDADSDLVHPVTGYKVQRVGSVGEAEGFQVPGDSDIAVAFDMGMPGQATSIFSVKGNLRVDGGVASSSRTILQSGLIYMLSDRITKADCDTRIADLYQFSGNFEYGDSITISGFNKSGDVINCVWPMSISTTLGDLIEQMNFVFNSDEESGATASLLNGEIRLVDNTSGYSLLDVELSFAGIGDARLETPGYFRILSLGGKDIKSVYVNVFDSLGEEHTLFCSFVKTDTANTWDLVLTSVGGGGVPSTPDYLVDPVIVLPPSSGNGGVEIPLTIDPNRVLLPVDPNLTGLRGHTLSTGLGFSDLQQQMLLLRDPNFYSRNLQNVDFNEFRTSRTEFEALLSEPREMQILTATDPNTVVLDILRQNESAAVGLPAKPVLVMNISHTPFNRDCSMSLDGRRIRGIEFDSSDGSFAGLNSSIGDAAEFAITFDHLPDSPKVIAIDMGTAGLFDGLTGFDGVSTAKVEFKDGYAAGQLASLSVEDGVVVGKFSNGMQEDIARVKVVLFDDADALNAIGQGYYSATPESGKGVGVGSCDDGAGCVISKYLENLLDDGVATDDADSAGIRPVRTSRALDAAIDGDGYFVVKAGKRKLYTRIGSFDFDVNNTLIDPDTGYKVQRIGTVGEEDGYQVAGDSNIYVSYDLEMPAGATTTFKLSGNLRAEGGYPGTATLTSGLIYLRSDGVSNAIGTTRIDSLYQFTGAADASDTITISGKDRFGAEIYSVWTVPAGARLNDLIAEINTSFSSASALGATASMSNGEIRLVDNTHGYSLLEINLSFSGAGGAKLETPGYFVILEAGGEDAHLTSIDIFDSRGFKHTLSGWFVKSDKIDNTWDFVLGKLTEDVSSIDGRRISGITFRAEDGAFMGVTDGSGSTFAFRFVDDPSKLQTVSISCGTQGKFDGLTQYSSFNSTAAAHSQDGFTVGKLANISIQHDGSLRGTFTNGMRKDIATIQLAVFDKPEKLRMVRGGYFETKTKSGTIVVTQPGLNGAGALRAGYLEDSDIYPYYAGMGVRRTDRHLDMIIYNEKFYFTLNDGRRDVYTRIGSFDLDADGVLVDPKNGFTVKRFGTVGEKDGYQVEGDSKVYILDDMVSAPEATTMVRVYGNLSQNEGDAKDIQFEIFDSLGESHVASATFVRTETQNIWDLVIKSIDGELPPLTERRIEGIAFNPQDGSYAGLMDLNTEASFEVKFVFAADIFQKVTFNFGTVGMYDGLTQFRSGWSTACAVNQNGYKRGFLEDVDVNHLGILVGKFSNGRRAYIAQIQLATFAAPWGLKAVDNGYFVSTAVSGEAIVDPTYGGGAYVIGERLWCPDLNLFRWGKSFGGGVYCSSPVTIRYCVIYNNSSDNGGGIYCETGSVIENTVIYGNNAVYDGGGVFCSILTGPKEPFNLPISSPVLEDTTIKDSILYRNSGEQGEQIALEAVQIWYTATGIGWPDKKFAPRYPQLVVSQSKVQGGEKDVFIKCDESLIFGQDAGVGNRRKLHGRRFNGKVKAKLKKPGISRT